MGYESSLTESKRVGRNWTHATIMYEKVRGESFNMTCSFLWIHHSMEEKW